MSDTIVVAVIGAAASIAAALIAAKVASTKIMQEMQIEIKVMQTKLEQMGKDLSEHNHYAKLFNENVPVIQEKLGTMNKQIETLEAGQRQLQSYHMREVPL